MESALHDAGRRFLALVREDIAGEAPNHPGIASGLARLDEVMALDSFQAKPLEAHHTVGCKWVDAGQDILAQTRPELAELIGELKGGLAWQANGVYPEEKFPDGYFDDWAFTQVIGRGGLFLADDLMLGMFAMGPNIFYPKHNHAAPELYYQLTGTHKWQRGDGPWTSSGSPAMIWHDGYEVHATETLDVPFLSIWMWSKDVYNWPVLT
ncbi:MAG: dimethylsulfonioproprionate lyase family protein [Pseudomonadota bacterium]